MKVIKIPENTRGFSDHGWLKAKFSFSFANWYNPNKMGFGALRVLNNDRIAGGQGFGTHPHRDMEIVTIPLKGSVAHKDSTGTDGIIKTGEVQIMSAGTGILHSEFNASVEEELELFQIWIVPERRGLNPRYDQLAFNQKDRQNRWQILVSKYPEKHTDQEQRPLKIYQEAYFKIANLEANKELDYELQSTGNGVYLMVIEGEIKIQEHTLEKRDAAEITNTTQFKVNASKESKILAIETTMYLES